MKLLVQITQIQKLFKFLVKLLLENVNCSLFQLCLKICGSFVGQGKCSSQSFRRTSRNGDVDAAKETQGKSHGKIGLYRSDGAVLQR